jgi:hypothetical protein
MALSQTAQEVITLADAIRHYWDTELPKRHPNYPMITPGEDSGPPPPEKKRLRDLLGNQPEEVIYSLVLIMYLGRGDFGAEKLAEQYEEVKKRFAKPEWAVAQMMEKAPLGDYLRDGLAELSKAGIDVDSLRFPPVRAAS